MSVVVVLTIPRPLKPILVHELAGISADSKRGLSKMRED
jgi:hypothetical protein